MKFRYFVVLSYCGTKYCGWQIQENAITVQYIVNDAFSKFFRAPVDVVGAGRTDTGVHAMNYIAHFELDKQILECDYPHILYKINAILPKDIAVHQICSVSNVAHARFSALLRTYHYYVTLQKDVFSQNRMLYCARDLDIQKMNEAGSYLIGNKDFTSFSKLHTDVTNNLCTVVRADWHVFGNNFPATQSTSMLSLQMSNSTPNLVFTIVANRFLRNMVRAIVGTLLDVGKGKISVNEFKQILDEMNRSKASSSAPAHGLYLVNIEYPKEIFIDQMD